MSDPVDWLIRVVTSCKDAAQCLTALAVVERAYTHPAFAGETNIVSALHIELNHRLGLLK